MRFAKGTWMALAVAVGLSPIGCKREVEQPVQKEQVEPAAEKVGTPEEAAKMAVEAAEVMAAAAEGVDTADAPEYLKKIAHHMKGINGVLKENMEDCAKSVLAINKYLEDHQADIEAMNKAAREAQDQLSDMEKMQVAQQAAALLAPVMQEFGGVQAAFAQKCPQELASIAGALRELQEGKK